MPALIFAQHWVNGRNTIPKRVRPGGLSTTRGLATHAGYFRRGLACIDVAGVGRGGRFVLDETQSLATETPTRGSLSIRKEANVRFSITHPIIGHPYDPALVPGSGIGAVATAAERAGFHGFGFTDHPAPTERWLRAGGHDALDPFVAMGFARCPDDAAAAHPQHRRPALPESLCGRQGWGDARPPVGRALHARGGRGLSEARVHALGVDHTERNELFDEALDVLKADLDVR